MFGTPERKTYKGESVFYVPLASAKPIQGQFRVESVAKGVEPDASYAKQFKELEHTILLELTKQTQLFRNPPSLESLQTICPKWGTVYTADSSLAWNPYMEIVCALSDKDLPGLVDLVLEGVYMSRSTITPRFSTSFLKKETSPPLIDFDWGAASSSSQSNELEEVSDIASAAEGTIAIKDPATMAREKAMAKERVRAAFRAAEAARDTAEDEAARFHAIYDLSDSESAFSEWESDGDESS